MNHARRNTHCTGGSGHSRRKDRRDEVENPEPPVKTRFARVKERAFKHEPLKDGDTEQTLRYRLDEEGGVVGNEVRLVDSKTGKPVDIPGGSERLERSPDWRVVNGVWHYVGPMDEHGYPANEKFLAEHRYKERVHSYEERFNYLTDTDEGYREMTEYAEREGVELSEAANRLLSEHGIPKPPTGGQVRGAPTNWEALEAAFEERARERASAPAERNEERVLDLVGDDGT
jgi:hypothetical protein